VLLTSCFDCAGACETSLARDSPDAAWSRGDPRGRATGGASTAWTFITLSEIVFATTAAVHGGPAAGEMGPVCQRPGHAECVLERYRVRTTMDGQVDELRDSGIVALPPVALNRAPEGSVAQLLGGRRR
jgi:hypothetical protein